MSQDKFLQGIERVVADTAWDAEQKTAFFQWLAAAAPEQLYRLNVFALADQLNVGRARLLELFIQMTGAGYFDIQWDYHCPRCHGIAESHNHLSEATTENHCPNCKVDFINALDQNIEVTFTPAGKYREIPEAFIQQQKMQMMEMLKQKTLRLPDPHVSGLDCFHIPAFQTVFSDDLLTHKESLAIKHVCILFTDIKGSTALYERLGDAKAYRLVREHFEILFEVIPRHGGVVIKTIGDSVMATFRSGKEGVNAALDIHHALREFNRVPVRVHEILVKMGLHTGPAVMVTLNQRFDYFGRMVNLAARVQDLAQECQILISEEMKSDPEVLAVLKEKIKSLMWREVEMKGIEDKKKVYRLNFKDESLNCSSTP